MVETTHFDSLGYASWYNGDGGKVEAGESAHMQQISLAWNDSFHIDGAQYLHPQGARKLGCSRLMQVDPRGQHQRVLAMAAFQLLQSAAAVSLQSRHYSCSFLAF